VHRLDGQLHRLVLRQQVPGLGCSERGKSKLETSQILYQLPILFAWMTRPEPVKQFAIDLYPRSSRH